MAKHNGKATASLVLGIISMIAWIIPLIGYPVSIVGLIMGFIGLKSEKRGFGTAGLILSIIGLPNWQYALPIRQSVHIWVHREYLIDASVLL